MMDYKESLLLPKTDFPMRGNLPQNEPVKYKQWDDKKVYEKMKKNRDSDISKEAIDAVLNQAVRDKKFVATMIPSFRKLLQDDFAGTVAMINEIPSITKSTNTAVKSSLRLLFIVITSF